MPTTAFPCPPRSPLPASCDARTLPGPAGTWLVRSVAAPVKSGPTRASKAHGRAVNPSRMTLLATPTWIARATVPGRSQRPSGDSLRGDDRRRWAADEPGVGGGLPVDRGVDASGGNADDVHLTQVAVLQVELPRKRAHAPLAQDIGAHARDPDVADDRADEDERPVPLPPQHRDDVACDVDRPDEVGRRARVSKTSAGTSSVRP